jgi:hydrogenase maturation protease
MNKILVLSIGNDIIGDDGAAFEAAKLLQERFPDALDIENVYGGGLEILDFMEGREKTLILDTISDELVPSGTVFEIEKELFQTISTNSPHYVGLPEVLKLAGVFELDFPSDIRILAIETEMQSEIREGLSPQIKDALPHFVEQAAKIINIWLKNE